MIQAALEFDVCANRHRGNAQSRAAHGRIVPRKNRLQLEVLALLRERPMTAKEMAEALGEPLHHLSGRCSELRMSGQIERTGEVRDGAAVLRRTA